MIKKLIFSVLLCIVCGSSFGQHSVSLHAILDDSLKIMSIDQELTYHNKSSDTLTEIYLNDWINAFKDKSTPLAQRFSEDYLRRFHFAREEERGSTSINSILNTNSKKLRWKRPEEHPDLVKIQLNAPLPPGAQTSINLVYSIKIPSDDFTRFGYAENGNYKLRYWFLSPAVYNDGWEVYSNKDLDDLYTPKLNLDLILQIPTYLAAVSALDNEIISSEEKFKTIRLTGNNRLDYKLYLTNYYLFEDLDTNHFNIISNMEDEGLNPVMRSMLVGRIANFLNKRLGDYPHQTMLVSREAYLKNPMLGLNQLPKFIRPFPDGFGFDLKQLKSITGNYLENSLLLNPRKEQWIFDAIQIYLMMEYVDEYYPEIKIIGNLSEIIGIRWFHAADLEFNDQYQMLYMHMARNNLDQALSTPKDSLINFNKILANPYKAGVGLKYLESFLQDHSLSNSINEFYSEYTLKEVSTEDFSTVLKKNASKEIDWFFETYVNTNEKIDFKIQKVKKEADSIKVTIKNKTQNNMPVSLFGLRNNEVVYKTWVEQIGENKTIKIPAEGIERLALNYNGVIPEFNKRDNFKGITTLIDKPFQLRLLMDVEDPHYYQLFVMPEFQYNLYDGIAIGPKLYNYAILEKNFEFQFAPKYGFNSETIVGGASFTHQIQFDNKSLYNIMYGASGNRFSYGYNLFYEKFTPFLSLGFRDENLRNNKRQYLTVRNVNVYREQDSLQTLEVPDYSVFNVNYSYRNTGMVDYLTGNLDFQLAKQFSKFSVTFEYRKLFKNNRQINLRFFGGAFIYNDLTDSNYFSFALDRPTDYLYDYNYYGRSETSGLFSQQIIMAEGGFKSQLEPEFANQWITTVNASTNIWKWIYAYGDLGLVKNKYENPKFLYDSGIRLSFIADYFELYFPVYSNLGWEIAQENYDQKIRFIVTLDVQTLIKFFSRDWY